MTYDNEGNKIDSLNPFKKSSYDIDYETTEFVTINNQIIEVIDTLKTWKLNEEGSERIENSREIKISRTEYKILENGKLSQN